MPGPTAFPIINAATNTGTQTVVTTAETVIATLANVNSRGANFPINITGNAVFAVSPLTTATTLRLRAGTVTGPILGAAQIVSGGVAGDLTSADGTIVAQYTPTLEVAGFTIVLTIQATGAGANWNVTMAQIVAQQ